jgi:predicted patatin/cPLA2 family phospholipase
MESSVRDLLRRRQGMVSARGNRADPYHLALVIEGGGMRGVVSGGMVSALEERSLLQCFDSVHGSSAGACAGAYFVAGQARLGTRIFYEDINNSSFISLRRAALFQPIMNTNYLIHEVMKHKKTLDVNEIISNNGRLNIVATDANYGHARLYNTFRDERHFFEILKASITIPVIAGSPVIVDGISLVDGALVQQIAIPSAIAIGATHILVLMSRGEIPPSQRKNQSLAMSLEAAILKLFHGQKLAEMYMITDKENLETIWEIEQNRGYPCVDIIRRKPLSTTVGRLTTDAAVLRRADEEARQAVFGYLDAANEDEPLAGKN